MSSGCRPGAWCGAGAYGTHWTRTRRAPSYGVYLSAGGRRRSPWAVPLASLAGLPAARGPRGAPARSLTEAWERAAGERVEIACGGGKGRTGTALACLAVLDGVPAGEAVAYVRAHYDRRAVETPWQRRYVRRF